MENDSNNKEEILMSLVCTFPDRVFTEMDQNDIIEICSRKSSYRPPDEKDKIEKDMDPLFQERNPQMPPLGSRVKRGRDWRYENQDDYGPGTVIGHSKRDEWLIVEWDTGLRWPYRFGTTGTPSDKYDVELCCDPRVLVNELIATGCLVTRETIPTVLPRSSAIKRAIPVGFFGKTGFGEIKMKVKEILAQFLQWKALEQ
uniref:MIB/HERC2 domain-containing protein n=1 Tax=Magallana gigas TaxID=29159 RepID=A0A8W8I5Z5_MAGGI